MSLIVYLLVGLLLGFATRVALPRLSLIPRALVHGIGVAGALFGGLTASFVTRVTVFELHSTAVIFAVVTSGLSLLVLDALQPAPPPLK